MKVLIQDENVGGTINHRTELEFENSSITVALLIEKRVKYEVEKYNNNKPEYYNGLVIPSDAEKTLNGYKLKTKNKIDPEKQVYVALDAFQKNSFFILIDDKQYDDLNQKIELKPNSIVSFIKLTPLVGG